MQTLMVLRRTYWGQAVKPAEIDYETVMNDEGGVLELLDKVVSPCIMRFKSRESNWRAILL